MIAPGSHVAAVMTGAILFAGSLAGSAIAEQPCAQWDVSGQWWAVQAGQTQSAQFSLQQNGPTLSGSALQHTKGSEPGDVHSTNLYGSVQGSDLQISVIWNSQSVGVYSGTINPAGQIEGVTFDQIHPNNRANWSSASAMNCIARAAAPAAPIPPKRLGDVKLPGGAAAEAATKVKPAKAASPTAIAIDDVDIYDGPGGQYKIIGMMIANEHAPVLGFHPDGWYRLDIMVNGGTGGWVAADHLTVIP